ncbi:MAG: hypothetical protein ACR2NN_02455 [Bryobacteraceae bacterium]
MKRQTVGLVGAGKFADATLFRALALAGGLGPVKAPSLRVASRIANTLRAGHPVPNYAEFEHCSLVLISVPDPVLADIVGELAAQSIAWDRKAVVLCSAERGSEELELLGLHGPHAGSLCTIPGFEHHWVLLEGDRLVESQIASLIDTRATRLTLIQPSRKPFYLAALACTGSLFVPMLMAAGEALEQSGVSATHASAILEKQIERSTRSFFKAGRKAHQESGDVFEIGKRLSAPDANLAAFLDEIARAQLNRARK